MPLSVSLPRLLLVTNRHLCRARSQVDILREATTAGLRFVQIREKDQPDGAIEDLVDELRDALPFETVLTLNGRPELARRLGLGLHLPANHPPPPVLPLRPCGRSAHNLLEIQAALVGSADYLVLGTIFPTASKPGHPGAGLEFLRQGVVQAAPLPTFAIGGMCAAVIPEVMACGVWGVAVSSAILEAEDVSAATRTLLDLIHRSLNHTPQV